MNKYNIGNFAFSVKAISRFGRLLRHQHDVQEFELFNLSLFPVPIFCMLNKTSVFKEIYGRQSGKSLTLAG